LSREENDTAFNTTAPRLEYSGFGNPEPTFDNPVPTFGNPHIRIVFQEMNETVEYTKKAGYFELDQR
jgi:hypothetical protein